MCCDWLTKDWTNDRDKWISLNFRFYWANRTQKVYECRIAFVVSRRCSLCWVLKVSVVKSLKLSCLLVCDDNTSWRCLVQIVGVAIWSGCRCCWRRSMMWRHWLQRLDDWCPGLCCSLLTGWVSIWPRVLVLIRAVCHS